MPHIEIVIGLLAGVALLGAIAERAGLPYPAVLVFGGLLLGLIPGLPVVHLDPHLVLLGFLPPLVYAAAFKAASFDLRAQAAHILTLSTGLVALTVAVVAAAGHIVAGLPWVAAVTLGALAAPTDPVSASSVMRSVGAPERILAILEGESLVNDGTGLAIFQVTVAAAAGTSVSIGHDVLKFLAISVGGAAIGLAGGWLFVRLRRRLDEPSLEIVLGLLAAFGPYVAANAAGGLGGAGGSSHRSVRRQPRPGHELGRDSSVLRAVLGRAHLRARIRPVPADRTAASQHRRRSER